MPGFDTQAPGTDETASNRILLLFFLFGFVWFGGFFVWLLFVCLFLLKWKQFVSPHFFCNISTVHLIGEGGHRVRTTAFVCHRHTLTESAMLNFILKICIALNKVKLCLPGGC